MKAELRKVDATNLDLRSFRPRDEAFFCFTVTMHIGTVGSAAVDMFDVEVCSPQWVEYQVQLCGIIDGRHKVIMKEFRFDELESHLEEMVSRVSGNNWASIALQLTQLGRWVRH